MSEPEQAVFVTEMLGYLPPTSSALNSQKMQDLFEKNPVYRVGGDQMKYAAPRPMEPAYKEISTILRTEIEKLMLEPLKTDAKAIIEKVALESNKLLQK